MYQLNKEEQKTLDIITNSLYMIEPIRLIEVFVNTQTDDKLGYLNAFDEIYFALTNSKSKVDKYLAQRKLAGEIKDEKQALKSIVGNSFSQIIVFIFLKNKILGNIREDIFITSQKSKVPSFEDISTINVDGETQKPDCDLVIYSLDNDKKLKKCIILSLKTSLRERAGQTYKWKLLMEIASFDNYIKEKYNIIYNPSVVPLVCFATVNFYDEINQPQQKGMFKFFDKTFIAKNIDTDFIARMSSLPAYINEVL